MNNVKKALIATSLAGALVVSAGYGTYSWFTAEKSVTSQIKNGTFTLGEASSPLYNHEKFAPSQLLMSNWISFQNTGDLDQFYKVTNTETLNMPSGSLANYHYRGWFFEVPISYELTDADKAVFENDIKNALGGNPVAKTAFTAPALPLPKGSSAQVVDSEEDAAKMAAAATTTRINTVPWERLLPAGYKIMVIYGVKLNENAGNEYQGAVYNSTVKVFSKQTDAGAQY
ncbi:hypothetical protein ACIFOT_21150 [Neobacillus sp. NRS-1170]|uniref:hypothetical protein n=1 Tax=Neobacillus sp. NRS-1170 TaxID=3233898 RepID=UPI003D2C207A